MNNTKVAAIVPALNEEANIGDVLKVLLETKDLDEVILVDGGSTDKTVEIGEKLGVRVIKTDGSGGKGNAMKKGVESTDAGIVVFIDADLINLSPEHISLLVGPILKKEAIMCVGIRERRGWGKISELSIKIDPLSAIAGERAMERGIFEAIPVDFIQGFMVETALNYYCLTNKLPVRYVKLKGLSIIIKEKKWGLVKGFLNRLKMYWQLLKIRILIFRRKKEFKIKNV